MKSVAVIPVKEFSTAKSRLSPVLGSAERAKLARSMLRDVIAQLAASDDLREIAIVGEGSDVRDFCQRLGILYLQQDGVTLNEAIVTGVEWARGTRADSALILSSDLPLLCLTDLNVLLNTELQRGIALAPAAHDGGTNALLQVPAGVIAPSFGEDSLRRHLAEARDAGCTARIVSSPSISFDIDRPEDLPLLLSPAVGVATKQFVSETGLKERLRSLVRPSLQRRERRSVKHS